MQKLLNKSSSKKFFSTLVMLSLVVPGVLLQVPQEAKAVGVAAGTVIGNQATAKYKDQNNNSYTSTSNLVTTTVSAVYGVTVTPNGTLASPGQTQSATPGTIVYFPYTLTNTGNTADTYSLATPVGSSGGGTFTPTNKKLYYDVNGNGIVDIGDIEIGAAGAGTSVSVPADGSIKLIVQYQVPSTGTSSNDFAAVDLTAASVGDNTKTDINNYNKTTVANDAVIAVTKSVDKASIDPSTSSTAQILTYTLDIANTGNKDADDIIIVDSIPANTRLVYNSLSAPGGGTFFYSTDGSTFTNASTTPLANQAAADSVVKIKYRLGTGFGGVLPAANNRAITFKVRVNDNSPATTIPNLADYEYKRTGDSTVIGDSNGTGGGGNPITDTNTVTTSINKKAAAQISFSGTPFSPTTTGTAGTEDPVYPASTSDRTIISSTPAGTYIYYRNEVTNNGNATDTFNVQLDAANSNLPSGAIVSFFALTDGSSGANNTSPLLDTNGDSIPDTGAISGVVPTSGAITGGTASLKSIVTRVFIPANASSTYTTTSTTATGTTITVADATGISGGDVLYIGKNQRTVASVAGNNITLNSAVTTVSGDAVTKTPVRAVIKASSTNGGTGISTSGGQNTFDTTANILTAIVAPKVNLYNVYQNTTNNTGTINLTQPYAGATTSFPLNVTNSGSSSDTFNLTASIANPAGSTVVFYPLVSGSTTTIAAPTGGAANTAGSTTITLTSAAGFTAGDLIVIDGQTLTVGSVAGNNVTFAAGQSLANDITTGDAVVERGSSAITSTNLLAAGASQQVIAVVTASSTTPGTYPITFTSTSTNNGTVTDSRTDNLVIPNFRTFTLAANRTGSVPPGGVLFYDHVITNTGNTSENYKISIPASANGISYQLVDTNGVTLPAVLNGGNLEYTTTGGVSANGTYAFKVKVIAPNGVAINTVSSINVNAQETTSLVTQTNLDVTTVVEGFISLNKTVNNFGQYTGSLTTDPGSGAAGTFPQGGGTSASGATAKPGDILEYRVDYSNIGSVNATEVSIADLIPANTEYVPGSLKINGTYATDAKEASGNADAADFNQTTPGGVSFNVGTGAKSDVGGTVTPGAGGNGYITFRVRVKLN